MKEVTRRRETYRRANTVAQVISDGGLGEGWEQSRWNEVDRFETYFDGGIQTLRWKKEAKWHHFKVFTMTSLFCTELWLNQIITYLWLRIKTCVWVGSQKFLMPLPPPTDNQMQPEFLSLLFQTLYNKVPNALSSDKSPLLLHILS